MGGLVAIRLQGPDSVLAWALVLLGLAALVPFARYEAAHAEPMVDVRLLATPGQWPVQLTAFLFGMSVLGAQIPLSTFARTDPDIAGYGLGADAVVRLDPDRRVRRVPRDRRLHAAADLPAARGRGARWCSARLLVALGYALWLPFHDSTRPGAGQHGDRRGRARARSSPRCPRPPRPRPRRTGPASRPA